MFFNTFCISGLWWKPEIIYTHRVNTHNTDRRSYEPTSDLYCKAELLTTSFSYVDICKQPLLLLSLVSSCPYFLVILRYNINKIVAFISCHISMFQTLGEFSLLTVTDYKECIMFKPFRRMLTNWPGL